MEDVSTTGRSRLLRAAGAERAIFWPLLRHWRASLPIMLLGGIAMLAAEVFTPPTYRADGALLLAAPQVDPSGPPAQVLDPGRIVDGLAREAARSTLEVSAELQVQMPDRSTVELVSRSTSASAAEETIEEAVRRLEQDLESAQAELEVPSNEGLTWRVLSSDPSAEAQVDGRFTATVTMALEGLDGAGGNPYGASADTARILQAHLNSDAGRQLVEERAGPNIDFSVSPPASATFPLMTISTSGTEPAEVLAAFDHVVAIADAELRSRQDRANVPPTRRLSLDVVAEPDGTIDTSPSLSGAAILAGALALSLAIGTTVLLEVRSRSMSGSRRPSDVPAPLDTSVTNQPRTSSGGQARHSTPVRGDPLA